MKEVADAGGREPGHGLARGQRRRQRPRRPRRARCARRSRCSATGATSRPRNLRRADRASASIGARLRRRRQPVPRRACCAASRRWPARAACCRSSAAPTRTPARERELAEAFLARRVDGLIVVPAGRRPLATCAPSATPAWRSCSSTARRRFIDADCVLTDNAGGASAATAHLIAARPPADRLPRRPGADLHGGRAPARLPRGARRARARRTTRALVRMELHDSAAASAAAAELLRARRSADRALQRART